MNRYELERYSIIAQIIDNVETDLEIDLYDYDEVLTEKISDNQYVVTVDYEKITITIDFNVIDNANYMHDTSVDAVVDYIEIEKREHVSLHCHKREYYSWNITYNHTDNHIIIRD